MKWMKGYRNEDGASTIGYMESIASTIGYSELDNLSDEGERYDEMENYKEEEINMEYMPEASIIDLSGGEIGDRGDIVVEQSKVRVTQGENQWHNIIIKNNTNKNTSKNNKRSNETINKLGGKLRITQVNVRGMSFDKQEDIKYTLKEVNMNVNDEWGKYEVHSARKESEGKAGGGGGHLSQREIRCERNKGIQ